MLGTAQAALVDKLGSYYKLDGNGDDTEENYDLTNFGATEDTTNYKYVSSMDFEEDSTNRMTSSFLYEEGQSFAVSMWIRPESVTGKTRAIGGWVQSATANPGAFYITSSGNLVFQVVTQGGSSVSIQASVLTAGQWYHIVGMYNSSNYNVSLYLNSDEVDHGTKTGGWTAGGGYDFGNFNLGRYGDYTGLYYDGIIDEVAIFYNYTINEDQIDLLYNSADGKEYPFVDNSPPVVTLVAPVDNNHTNALNVTFNWTVDDDDGTNLNCSFILNNSGEIWRENYFNLPNGTEYTTYNNSIDEGLYNWTVNCTDSQTVDYSELRSLVVDRTAPLYFEQYISTENTTLFNNPLITLLNFTGYWIDTYMFAWNHTISNSSGTTLFTNETTGLTGTYEWVNHTINITGWNSGLYYSNHTGSDDHTNNTIPYYNITIVDCDVSFDTPTATIDIESRRCDGGTVITERLNDRYTFRFTSNEPSSTWTFDLTSTEKLFYRGDLYEYPSFVTGNQWVDFNTGITTTIYEVKREDDYLYEIEIETEDESNEIEFNSIGGLNTNAYSYLFRIDYQPEVTTNTPFDGENVTNQTTIHQFTVTDTDSTSFNCFLYIGESIVNSSYGLAAGTHTLKYTFPTDNSVFWHPMCSDGYTNVSGSTYKLNVDYRPPIYSEEYLNTDNSSFFRTSDDLNKLNFTGYWNDTHFQNFSFQLRNSTNIIYNNLSSYNSGFTWSNHTINLTGYAPGNFQVWHQGNDSYGNSADYYYNFTLTSDFTLDFYYALLTVKKIS